MTTIDDIIKRDNKIGGVRTLNGKKIYCVGPYYHFRNISGANMCGCNCPWCYRIDSQCRIRHNEKKYGRKSIEQKYTAIERMKPAVSNIPNAHFTSYGDLSHLHYLETIHGSHYLDYLQHYGLMKECNVHASTQDRNVCIDKVYIGRDTLNVVLWSTFIGPYLRLERDIYISKRKSLVPATEEEKADYLSKYPYRKGAFVILHDMVKELGTHIGITNNIVRVVKRIEDRSTYIALKVLALGCVTGNNLSPWLLRMSVDRTIRNGVERATGYRVYTKSQVVDMVSYASEILRGEGFYNIGLCGIEESSMVELVGDGVVCLQEVERMENTIGKVPSILQGK